jgi:rhodanese-related sulfurtransferase
LIVDSRLDVEEQFDAGHIKGAIPVPLSKIMEGQWLPPADKEIIFYCS